MSSKTQNLQNTDDTHMQLEKSKGREYLTLSAVKYKISKEISWSTRTCTGICTSKYGNSVLIQHYYCKFYNFVPDLHAQNKIMNCIRQVADTFQVKMCKVKIHPCEKQDRSCTSWCE